MSTDTRTKILDAAESLFADKGFAATSLRDITSVAGVNLAAVNYHFGSKDELLAAALERRIAPVNHLRLQLLDQAEAAAGGEPIEVELLLRALLAPPFRQADLDDAQRTRFLQLVGRLCAVPHDRVRAIVTSQFQEVTRRFVPAFQRALPHLDADDVGCRIFFVIGTMFHTMTWYGMIQTFGGRAPRDSEEMLELLVQFSEAGMRAPAPARVAGVGR